MFLLIVYFLKLESELKIEKSAEKKCTFFNEIVLKWID